MLIVIYVLGLDIGDSWGTPCTGIYKHPALNQNLLRMLSKLLNNILSQTILLLSQEPCTMSQLSPSRLNQYSVLVYSKVLKLLQIGV